MAAVTALAEMWLAAAKDLGIRVSAPFVLEVQSGSSFKFDALVHDFGSDKGTAVMATWGPEKADAVAAQGFGYSCMKATDYDRQYIIEVLKDWGWAGPQADTPEWLHSAATEIVTANGDYLRLEVVGPGTAGIPHDCRIAASMKCGAFSGAVEAWLEGLEVEAFIESLISLSATLHGQATLLSDDGRTLSIVLAPSDSLGHYALEVRMANELNWWSKTHESSAAGFFLFEGEALRDVCKALIEGVRGKRDV